MPKNPKQKPSEETDAKKELRVFKGRIDEKIEEEKEVIARIVALKAEEKEVKARINVLKNLEKNTKTTVDEYLARKVELELDLDKIHNQIKQDEKTI